MPAAGTALASPFKNIARLSLGDFVAKALNFAAFVYLARILGVAQFGVLEFANALLTWFLLLGDAGVEVWATREAAQTRDLPALAGRILPLRFVISLAAFAALLLTLPLLPDEPRLKTLLVLFGLSIFMQAGNLKWVFMGREQMARVAGGLVISQIIFAISVFLLVPTADRILWVAGLKVASDAALAVYFAQLFFKENPGRVTFDFRGGLAILRPAATIGTSQAMGLLNYNFDSIMLGFLRGVREVGWYNAAYKPVTIALALPLTYFIGLFPALSRTWAEGPHAFRPLVTKSFRLCCIFAIPLGIGGTLLAKPIVGLLFGADYAESVLPFQILVWSAVFVVLRGSYRHSLNAAGEQNLDLRCAITSAALNVGLNLLLIPKFGMAGSAAATVFADVVWFALAAHYFQRLMPLAPWSFLARPILAGAAMGAWLWYAPHIHWMASAAIGVGIYFAGLAVLGEPEVRGWITSRQT